ncbi:MAG: carbon-nitrogen hydrolase family protein [Streptosporangiales bacterium]|nr:carbon-nitrogen hydrolase family protein [Streptosporangiales bacterium]MBO0889372.1 carbon-nitrogen hydrolase family protein [Acidothermales bacterium]
MRTKVAVLQFAAGPDKTENLGSVRRLFDLLQQRDGLAGESAPPDLVVLPEATMREFGPPGDPLAPHAEPLDGPFVQTLAKLARGTETNVVAGIFERADGGERVYNTLVVLDRGGELVATYRKVHLYDAFSYLESDRLIPGTEEPPVLDDLLPGLHVGLITCYDLRFPEITRSLADRGADVVVVPAAWVSGPLKENHWATLVRARAIENTTYVVACDQCGRTCSGNSMVVDPQGIVVASLGEQEDVLTAELDTARIRDARRTNPSLANRRYPVARLTV